MKIESLDTEGFRLTHDGMSVAVEPAYDEEGAPVGFVVTSGTPMTVIPNAENQIQVHLVA